MSRVSSVRARLCGVLRCGDVTEVKENRAGEVKALQSRLAEAQERFNAAEARAAAAEATARERDRTILSLEQALRTIESQSVDRADTLARKPATARHADRSIDGQVDLMARLRRWWFGE